MSPCRQTCSFQFLSENGAGGQEPAPDLLEVRSKPVHVLVIGQQSVVLSVEEVDVPDPQQRQQDGGILVQGSSAEVVVLRRRTSFTVVLSASPPVGDA